jgi:pseudaminic acid cytidylyltransferase
MTIAIIPSRGGGIKRIPQKIKVFCGQPMIVYAIQSAQNSGLFGHVSVSPDETKIQSIAILLGAKTPIGRPPELANDFNKPAEIFHESIKRVALLTSNC